jgi:hypothetical protein
MVVPRGARGLLQLLVVREHLPLQRWAFARSPPASSDFGPCANLLSPNIASHIDTIQTLYASNTLLAFWSTSSLHCHCTASRPSFTGAVHRLTPSGASRGRSSNNRYITSKQRYSHGKRLEATTATSRVSPLGLQHIT